MSLRSRQILDAIRALIDVIRGAGRTDRADAIERDIEKRDPRSLTEADIAKVAAQMAARAEDDATRADDGEEDKLVELEETKREQSSNLRMELDPGESGIPGSGAPEQIGRDDDIHEVRSVSESDIEQLFPAEEIDDASVWHLSRDYGAFFEELPGGRALIDQVSDLLGAESVDELIEAARTLFVSSLGYDAEDLDMLPRTVSRSAFNSFRSIACFGRFKIFVLETGGYLSTRAALPAAYRLASMGMLLVRDGLTGAKEVVLRVEAGYRRKLLSGARPLSDIGDDLLVWAWRLGQMMPGLDDDEIALTRRCSDALEGDLLDWSAALGDACLPWMSAPERERYSFLQSGRAAEKRIHWGLEARLREAFPVWCRKHSVLVRYLRHVIEDESGLDVAPLQQSEQSLGARLVLQFELVFDDGQTRAFDLPCFLPLWNDDGRFVIDGVLLQYTPRIGPGSEFSACRSYSFTAQVADEDTESLWDDLDSEPIAEELDEPVIDQTIDVEEDTAEGGQDEGGESSQDDEETRRSEDLGEFVAGASLERLMRSAVQRKLYLLRRTFRSLTPGEVEDPSRIRLRLLSFLNAEFRFNLCGLTFLHAQLENCSADDPWRVMRRVGELNEDLPAWACPDLSSDLPVDCLAAVAAAVLHPSGRLCLPLNSEGEIRLQLSSSTAHDVNPRLGGSLGAASSLWIDRRLARWHELPPGVLEMPRRVALARDVSELRVVLVTGDSPKAWLGRQFLQREIPVRCSIMVRLPVPLAQTELDLVLQVGQEFRGGDVWLRVPASVWQRPSRNPWRVGNFAAQLLGCVVSSPIVQYRLPMMGRGRVAGIHVEKVRGRFGLTIGTRVLIELVVVPEIGCSIGGLVLPDGSVCEASMREALDMPFADDGVPSDAFLVVPSLKDCKASGWRDGTSGERIETCLESRLRWVRPLARSQVPERDPHARYRLLDGELIPRDARTPSISEGQLRWWALRDPVSLSHVIREGGPALGRIAGWLATTEVALRAAGLTPRRESCLTPFAMVPSRAAIFDVVRSGARTKVVPKPESDPLMRTWSCDCGRLEGLDRLPETCIKCESGVSLRIARRGVAIPRISLCLPILNPLQDDIAAAMLGLTTGEWGALLETNHHSELVALVNLASRAPFECLEARLRTERDQARKAELLRLQEMLVGSERPGIGRVVLNSIGGLPAELRGDGVPTGADRILFSRITEQVRTIQRMNAGCQGIDSVAHRDLRDLAHDELARRVRRYIAGEDGSSRFDRHSLVGLIRDACPLSRPEHDLVTLDGLMVLPVEDPGAWSSGGAPEVTKVVELRDRCLRVPASPTNLRRPCDPNWWAERRAANRMENTLLVVFSLALEHRLTPTDRSPTVVERARVLSIVAALSAALENSEAAPDELVRMLDQSCLTELDLDDGSCKERLSGPVERAFPGTSAEIVESRRVLVAMLCGFCRLDGRGWQFLRAGDSEDGLERRVLPPISSSLWELIPAVCLMRKPGRFFAEMVGKNEPEIGDLAKLLLRIAPLEVAVEELVDVSRTPREEVVVTSDVVVEPVILDLVQESPIDPKPEFEPGGPLNAEDDEVTLLEIPVSRWLMERGQP